MRALVTERLPTVKPTHTIIVMGKKLIWIEDVNLCCMVRHSICTNEYTHNRLYCWPCNEVHTQPLVLLALYRGVSRD